MLNGKWLPALAGVTIAALSCAPPVRAEVSEVNLAKQYGVAYLQLVVMEEQKLVEKHAKALGLDALKATYVSLASSAGMTDGLLSGSIQVASGGIHAQLILWDKTKGEVKGIGGTTASPLKLLTLDPNVKSIKDLTEKHRIALPAAKLSPQAIYLQMAVATAYGQENFAKLDTLTVSSAHPDSYAAMVSKGTEINCYFATPPYLDRLLKRPGVYLVASSYEMMGVKHASSSTAYVMAKFARENPKAIDAVARAFAEATDFMKNNKRAAAELYLKSTGDKDTVENITAILSDPEYEITYVPYGVMRNAEFMHKIGLLKTKPQSVSELFLPNLDLTGAD